MQRLATTKVMTTILKTLDTSDIPMTMSYLHEKLGINELEIRDGLNFLVDLNRLAFVQKGNSKYYYSKTKLDHKGARNKVFKTNLSELVDMSIKAEEQSALIKGENGETNKIIE